MLSTQRGISGMNANRAAWTSYLNTLAGKEDSPHRAIAAQTGIHPSTVYRWFHGTVPTPERVIQVARAYGRDPVEALIAAGILTKADLTKPASGWIAANSATTATLLRELGERVSAAPVAV
jgi:transcriptional regulator with XRE-family HTH domain